MAKYSMFYSILSAIRKCFSRSPTHRLVLASAKTDAMGPRGGARYKCSICSESFGSREIHVDHIEPVVPIGRKSEDMSWDEIVSRIFCPPDNLQCICVRCHKLKSKEENDARSRERRESRRTKEKRPTKTR